MSPDTVRPRPAPSLGPSAPCTHPQLSLWHVASAFPSSPLSGQSPGLSHQHGAQHLRERNEVWLSGRRLTVCG